MMELYIKENKLISYDEWRNILQGIRLLTKEQEDYKELLAKTIEQAILKRAQHLQAQKKNIGVFLSGGVDSALITYILAKNKIPITAYTVAFMDGNYQEPKDIAYAKKLSQELGIKQVLLTLNIDTAEALAKTTASILKEQTSALSLGVGMVEVAALQEAQVHNIDALFAGLGAEELFAGYQHHAQADNINESCWQGLHKMHDRDLKRDVAIGAHFNIALPTPFLDEELIELAMSIAGEEKVRKHQGIVQKKYCLRQAAELLGLNQEFVWRPKLAAQYGSRMDDAIYKVAKKHNMSKQAYIEQLLEQHTKAL